MPTGSRIKSRAIRQIQGVLSGMAQISLKRVSIALGLIFALVVAIGLVVDWRTKESVNQLIQSPETGSRVIIAAVRAWQADKQGCPTARELQDAKLIDPFHVTDRWRSRYLIECAEERLKVRSLGPDRKLDTPDDVVVSERK